MYIVIENNKNILQEAEYKLIEKCLEATDGNRTKAADMLGINVRTLRNKLSQYTNISNRFSVKGNEVSLCDKLLLLLFQKKYYNLTKLAEYFNVTPITISSRLKKLLGRKAYKKQLDKNRFIVRKFKPKQEKISDI